MTIVRYCSLSKTAALVVGIFLIASPARPQADDAPAKLLAPRPAFRLLENADANFSYLLNAPPDNPVVLEIHDSAGALVAAVHPENMLPGLNRVDWDLRWEPPQQVFLRTTPPEDPHIWEDPRFQGAETRPVGHKGIDLARTGPIAAPGVYSVELHVDKQVYKQPLEIRIPPNSHGTEADIQAMVKLQLRVRDDINAAARVTNQIEVLRKQLEDEHKHSAAPAIEALDGKLQAVEYQLISRGDALSDDKNDSEARLYVNFLWLNLTLGSSVGKYDGGGDYAPTDMAVATAHKLEDQLHAVEAQYRKAIDEDLPAYNRAAAAAGLHPLHQ